MSMDETRDQPTSQNLSKVICQLLDSGTVAVLVTVVAGNANIGAKLLIDEAGDASGSLGDVELDSVVAAHINNFIKTREETRTFPVSEFAPESTSKDVRLLFERISPAPRLVVCGAGHVGAALAKLGHFLGYQTSLVDDRADFLTRERLPETSIELIVAESWIESVRDVVGSGKGVAVAVVTRGHSQDEECMRAVVSAQPDYVGLIGSKRRTTIVIDRLRQAGASEEQLANIHAPIGLDIGAVSPEEVALAIMAEIVAERYGASGASLSSWRRSERVP
jgi:xanthine dehydrogenase accessory factor